jgi:hypothetical protein
VSGNERLPGAVVLARERLLERLRGMPPSETRSESFILWTKSKCLLSCCTKLLFGSSLFFDMLFAIFKNMLICTSRELNPSYGRD